MKKKYFPDLSHTQNKGEERKKKKEKEPGEWGGREGGKRT